MNFITVHASENFFIFFSVYGNNSDGAFINDFSTFHIQVCFIPENQVPLHDIHIIIKVLFHIEVQ